MWLMFSSVVLITILVYTLLTPIGRYIVPGDPQFSYPLIYETVPGSVFLVDALGSRKDADK